jgi:hypothetical protein
MIIPRSPTEVYYDVSTEKVEAQLYNWFYCCNTTSNANCPTSKLQLAFHNSHSNNTRLPVKPHSGDPLQCPAQALLLPQ